MKIQNSTGNVYFPQGKPPQANRPAPEKAPEKPAHAQKLNIPRDFAPRKKLNTSEQRFFEKMFPGARKEIQNYLKQQNKVVPEKGKYIDLKG